VPITTHAAWVRALQGITVHDVSVRVVQRDESLAARREEILAERRGAVLFAHFGLSGPAILDVSRVVSGHPRTQSLRLLCDFLPAMSLQEVEDHLLREGRAAGSRQVAHLLPRLLPHRLAEELVRLAGIPVVGTAAELSRDQRRRLVGAAKSASIPIAGTMGFRKAEVTAGGVALDQVDSRTMQSKLVPGLYFAGELLDLDGPIGGYNFQAAFSTGCLAGELGK
jgi:predicted Rossmann fold flavoprotein